MRQTTPEPAPTARTGRQPPDAAEPSYEPHTVTRYRVSLVREEATPYDAPQHCNSPLSVARFARRVLDGWDREAMGVLFLDTRGRAIGYQIAFVGTLNRIAVEPRGIFTAALLAHAASIVLFHNHPSGDPTPSLEDLEFTRTIRDAGAILGIPLTDHLVIGEGSRWVSLRQRDAF